jgi:hypothetical protein
MSRSCQCERAEQITNKAQGICGWIMGGDTLDLFGTLLLLEDLGIKL